MISTTSCDGFLVFICEIVMLSEIAVPCIMITSFGTCLDIINN